MSDTLIDSNRPKRVAAIQMVSTDSTEENLQQAKDLIAEAVARGADLVLLPENFAVLEGGPMVDFAEPQGVSLAASQSLANQTPLQNFLSELASHHGITLVGGTLPLITRPEKEGAELEYLSDGRVRPACLVFNPDGKFSGRYDKIHLFDVQVNDQQAQYSESRSFEAGENLVVLDSPCGKLGLSICYDLRFPELYRQLFHQGAQIITIPSAFTAVTGKAHWESLLRARAIENQSYVIAANQGGRHSESRETWGHSMIVDPWGVVLDCVETGPGVAIADINLSHLQTLRSKMPIQQHCRFSIAGGE